jgi:hypothetical protein
MHGGLAHARARGGGTDFSDSSSGSKKINGLTSMEIECYDDFPKIVLKNTFPDLWKTFPDLQKVALKIRECLPKIRERIL